MSAAEKAKSIVGKPYTTTREKELQAMVPGQHVDKLTPGAVRTIASNTTYVVIDADEKVVAVLAGA